MKTTSSETDQVFDGSLPPNAEQLINALRQIGYSFEQAVADLIDNSINAKAHNVLIRIIHDDSAIQKLLIVDDGHGMAESLLRKAMRFGAHEDAGDLSLGKFGMGMKLASFSHSKTLSVFTRSGGVPAGRRWTVEGISRNWSLETISTSQVQEAMGGDFLGLDVLRCGTLVEWSRIDRLSSSKNGVDATLNQLFARLKVHVGLHFHRFLEAGRLSIQMDSQHILSAEADRAVNISPLNPFKYELSGSLDFPKTFPAELPQIGVISASAHIWPPNNKSPEYRLGNRAASRQGFYFYRNDRLIQAGGWNGVVEHETEPHTSLARVAIELPESMDEHFGLNVQKSLVIVPPTFVDAVQKSKSEDGVLFSKYRALAERTYRKKDDRAQSDYPLTPSGTIANDLVRFASEVLAEGGKSRQVGIVWEELEDPASLFEVDREGMRLLLNKRFRKRLLGERRASSTDLPVLKLLLFFILEEDFDKSRQSASRRKRLESITKLLLAAIKQEA
ncbi:ATP-binding protein [Dyella kyungheensis]|uniref:ATP-binding protein n=1 Tax=Dyella kyungheensis TaxID=1242174 RepID=UPI003CF5289A